MRAAVIAVLLGALFVWYIVDYKAEVRPLAGPYLSRDVCAGMMIHLEKSLPAKFHEKTKCASTVWHPDLPIHKPK